MDKKQELEKRIKEISPEKLDYLLRKYRSMSLTDDELMNIALRNNKEAVQEIIRPIMGDKTLKVTSVKVQEYIQSSLYGKTVKLDILAEDSNKRLYNVEMQNLSIRANIKRARLYLSALDSECIAKKTDYDELPECYIIFIVDGDYFGYGDIINHIEPYVSEKMEHCNLGQHIIYLNCTKADDSELGRLISDLKNPDSKKMYSSVLSEAMDRAKGKEGEHMYVAGYVDNEGEIYAQGLATGLEKGITVGAAETQKQNVLRMKDNNLSDSEISKLLGIEESLVKEILEKKNA